MHHTLQTLQVGAYADMCKERFERCLDLYLCPRAFKRRLNIDPESLVPRLPRPRDLRPFPNELCLTFGTSGGPRVRSLAVSEDGQYLCSGDEKGQLQLWEVATARRLSVLELGGSNPKARAPIAHMAWNPCGQHHVLAVAVGSAVVLMSTGTAGGDALDVTEALLAAAAEVDGATTTAADGSTATADATDSATADTTAGADSDSDSTDTTAAAAKPLQDAAVAAAKRTAAVWEKVAPVNSSSSSAISNSSGAGSGNLQVRAVIRCAGDVGWVAWHRKGDYLVSVVPSPNAGSGAVAVHQVRVTQRLLHSNIMQCGVMLFYYHYNHFASKVSVL
jgi:ribosome biogenesis protein ERB1